MTEGEQRNPTKWSVFAAVGPSYFITVMTTTLSILALRAIAEDFDVTLRTVGWVVIVESLIIASLLMPFGGLSDVVGRHRMLRAGVAVFGIGLLLTGLSPSFAWLLAARTVTALGNTMVQSVSTGILVGAFPSEERGLALSAQTTAVSLGAALGPLLGGLLLGELDWRVLFLLLAIPTAVTFLIVHRVLPLEPRVRLRGESTFDFVGATLAALFIVLLVFTVNDPFEFGFTSFATAISLAISILMLGLFVKVELDHKTPMLNVRIFRVADFRRAVSIRIVAFIASSSIMFLIPVYLLSVRDLSTRGTGGIFALFAVGMTCGAQISGRLYDRLGGRLPMMIGLTLQCTVLIFLARLGEGSALGLVALASFGNGLSQGLWNVPANSIMMGAMPASALGIGGAMTNVTRTIGSAVGQAGATAIIAGVMVSQGFDIPLGDVSDTAGAGGAFVDGWQATYIVAAIVAALALAIAFRTTSRPHEAAGAK